MGAGPPGRDAQVGADPDPAFPVQEHPAALLLPVQPLGQPGGDQQRHTQHGRQAQARRPERNDRPMAAAAAPATHSRPAPPPAPPPSPAAGSPGSPRGGGPGDRWDTRPGSSRGMRRRRQRPPAPGRRPQGRQPAQQPDEHRHEHPPRGRAAPVAPAPPPVAVTASAPATPTAARVPPGGKIAARAQPAANRHRAARSCTGTWASSAAMAAPQSRRSASSVALAAASSRAGPSSADSLAPACRHQARHSSQAATAQSRIAAAATSATLPAEKPDALVAVHVPSSRGRRPTPPTTRAVLAAAGGPAASLAACARPGPLSQ